MPLSVAVLAGGASRRFGDNKLLAQLSGRPLLFHALDAALAADGGELLLAAGSTEVEKAARLWSAQANAPLKLVPVRTAAEGMGGTFRALAGALAADAEGLIIFLADMPLVPPGIASLLAECRATAAAPQYKGRRGHPVLLRRTLFPALSLLSGDRGAASLLSGACLVEVDDDGVLFDVDTPEDLAEAERRIAARQQQRPPPPL